MLLCIYNSRNKGQRYSYIKMASKRGANFSTAEKEILINLVTAYKDTIENKKTDSVSVKQKEECWNQICNDLNCNSISNHRSVNSLKSCWDNLKKKTRKHYADLRRDRFATGGGKSQVSEDPMYARIKSMIDLTVTPLENPFDSEEIVGTETSWILDGNPNDENSGDEDEYPIEILDDALDPDLIHNSDWTKWNPAMLRHPKSQSLQTNQEKKVQIKERTEEENKENSVPSPTNVNVKRAHLTHKRKRLPETQQKPSAAYRNKQFIELAESKKELVEILKEEERTKSSLEIEILKVKLEKERCALEKEHYDLKVAKTKLLVYEAILEKRLPYPVNFE